MGIPAIGYRHPISRVFSRIVDDADPSIAEVERALNGLQVSAAVAAMPAEVSPGRTPADPDHEANGSDSPPRPALGRMSQAQELGQHRRPALHQPPTEAGLQEVLAPATYTPTDDQAPTVQERSTPTDDQTPTLQEQQQEPAIDDLFTALEPPLVLLPPQWCPQQRRTFDMSAVRRSARLAKRSLLPAVQRAQRNLWRKLGISNDEMKPIEEILQDFIRTFSGPLPEHILAAMTALFNLDDDDDDLVHDALIQYVGEAAPDIQQEIAASDD